MACPSVYHCPHLVLGKNVKAKYSEILEWCIRTDSLPQGKAVHSHIVSKKGERDRRKTHLANLLVLMYSKSGRLAEAQGVFDRICPRNLYSWNIMVAAYAQSGGLQRRALELFGELIRTEPGFKPDKYTFASLLSASSHLGSLATGKPVHAHMVSSGVGMNVVMETALITMYGKCGSLKNSRLVFDRMLDRSLVSWNAMITSYARNGYAREALELFARLDSEPNRVTFLGAIDACASLKSLEDGKAVHRRIVKLEVPVGNALISMYGKCGCLKEAQGVFDNMGDHDSISWTALIAAYAQNGHGDEALAVFCRMRHEGGRAPGRVTFLGMLEACVKAASLKLCKSIHAHVVAYGSGFDVVVETAVVNAYGKCGCMKDARAVFDRLHRPNVVSWNAIIGAYAHTGNGREALELFRQMSNKEEEGEEEEEEESIMPNKITFLNTLEACASLSSLEHGGEIHEHIKKSKFNSDASVNNALINMYSKCGNLSKARAVFDGMPRRNVISWTSIMNAYAHNGYDKEALELFEQMVSEGVKPDEVAFLIALNACSHAGFLEEGLRYFSRMSRDYRMKPSGEHYVCIIDLLGRAGCLAEAQEMMNNMPIEHAALGWMTLLGSCRLHLDVERGANAARHVFKLDPDNDAAYILLYNLYAATGNWDDAAKTRKAMEEKGIKKVPGCSWIELEDGNVHGFFSGDRLHPRSDEIYAELGRLSARIKEAGYLPDTAAVLHNVEEEEKERMLHYHSEKLTIAFGILCTPPQTPLRIIKNLRVCSDCHNAIKYISTVEGREIIVRDANRFHHFKHGVCSCGDYW